MQLYTYRICYSFTSGNNYHYYYMMTEFDHFDDKATEKTHMHMHANRETRRQNKDALHNFLDIHQFPYLSLANYIPI